MKRRSFLALTIFIVALLPSLATAAVILNNPISFNTSPNHSNQLYLSKGPGYTAASGLGYLSLTGNAVTSTGGQSLYINGTPGTGSVALVNSIEIVNQTGSGFNGKVMAYLNGTLPDGVELYYSSSPMSYNGASVTGGYALTPGQGVHITSAIVYVSIDVSGTITSTQNDIMTLQTVYS